MRRAFTLIELLIVIAIMAIMAAGLVFSSTQIFTRTSRMDRTFAIDDGLGMAVETLTADVAASTSHIGDSTHVTLSTATSPEHTITYALDAGRMTRTDGSRSSLLLSDNVSGEFTFTPEGLTVALSASFNQHHRTISRRADLFLAWPESVGVRP